MKTSKAMAKLQRSALESCNFRGHTMSEFRFTGAHCTASECTKCGMQVACDTHPAPNDIDIGGEAVALNCGD